MDENNLKIVDTSDVLTKEELRELKKLAQLSKTAKIVVGVVFSIMMFVGIDHFIEWFHKK